MPVSENEQPEKEESKEADIEGNKEAKQEINKEAEKEAKQEAEKEVQQEAKNEAQKEVQQEAKQAGSSTPKQEAPGANAPTVEQAAKEKADPSLEMMRKQMEMMQAQMQQMQQMMQQMQQTQNRSLQMENQRRQEKEQKKEEKSRKNAKQIEEQLADRIKRHERNAAKAAKGKYQGKRMPSGMEPKYYYAAVRDFHKEMAEKIGKIQDPKKREEYYAAYYTQKRMNAYVNFRAKDPVYCRMVDKYKSGDVLANYQKARLARSEKGIKNMPPIGGGFSAGGEADKLHGFDTSSKLYTGAKNEDQVWKDFTEQMRRFNEQSASLAAEGKSSEREITELAYRIIDKTQAVLGKYEGNSKYDAYMQEAKKVKDYAQDVLDYGTVGANLRRDYRETIEQAKNQKVDYRDPAKAADLVLAKYMMGDSPKAKEYWEKFPSHEEGIAKQDAILGNVAKNRASLVTDPTFNKVLLNKENASLDDFAKAFPKEADKEAKRLSAVREKELKEREKETRRLLKQEEKKQREAEKKKEAERNREKAKAKAKEQLKPEKSALKKS